MLEKSSGYVGYDVIESAPDSKVVSAMIGEVFDPSEVVDHSKVPGELESYDAGGVPNEGELMTSGISGKCVL